MSVDGAVVVEACGLLGGFPADLCVSLLIGFLVMRSFDMVDVVIEVAVNVRPSTRVRMCVC